jgi:hypothetical protein
MKEPILILVVGGTTLLQAAFQLLVVFGVPITRVQQAAITTFVTCALSAWARAHVTPVATLPPGVAAQIDTLKAIQKAG